MKKFSTSVLFRDIGYITLFGQIADSIGAVIGNFSGLLFDFVTPASVTGNQRAFYAIGFILLLKFVCSGIATGGLSWWFARRRWQLSNAQSWLLAILAAIFTNPLYFMVWNNSW